MIKRQNLLGHNNILTDHNKIKAIHMERKANNTFLLNGNIHCYIIQYKMILIELKKSQNRFCSLQGLSAVQYLYLSDVFDVNFCGSVV